MFFLKRVIINFPCMHVSTRCVILVGSNSSLLVATGEGGRSWLCFWGVGHITIIYALRYMYPCMYIRSMIMITWNQKHSTKITSAVRFRSRTTGNRRIGLCHYGTPGRNNLGYVKSFHCRSSCSTPGRCRPNSLRNNCPTAISHICTWTEYDRRHASAAGVCLSRVHCLVSLYLQVSMSHFHIHYLHHFKKPLSRQRYCVLSHLHKLPRFL